MRITLPISHIINKDNIKEIPNVEVYQIRNPEGLEKLPKKIKPKIYHDSKGIVCNDFMDHFLNLFSKSFYYLFELYSTNLMPVSEEYKMVDGPSCRYYDCKNPLRPDELLEKVKYKLQQVRHFADVIALENGNKYPYYDYEYIFNPNWLKKALKELDVKFCFDIGHAIVSYNNHFFKYYDRIEDFILDHPLEDTVEVHLSKPDYSRESVDIACYDMHNIPGSLEWRLLKLIIPYLSDDVFVAVEYYGQIELVKSVYSKLSSILEEGK